MHWAATYKSPSLARHSGLRLCYSLFMRRLILSFRFLPPPPMPRSRIQMAKIAVTFGLLPHWSYAKPSDNTINLPYRHRSKEPRTPAPALGFTLGQCNPAQEEETEIWRGLPLNKKKARKTCACLLTEKNNHNGKKDKIIARFVIPCCVLSTLFICLLFCLLPQCFITLVSVVFCGILKPGGLTIS